MNEKDLIAAEGTDGAQTEGFAAAAAKTAGRSRPVSETAPGDHACVRAAQWVPGEKVVGSAALSTRLELAMEAITEAGRRMAPPDDEHENSGGEERDFTSNLRLMRAASLEVRETLKSEIPVRQLKQVEDDSVEFPRPYVAARAYLADAQGLFDEDAFAEYMQAFQETRYLEIHEIWALKPMMQLVVLECLAAKVTPTGDAVATAAVATTPA